MTMRAQVLRLGRAAALALSAGVAAQVTWAQDRGQMLYETHCIACHTAQVHWREQRLAKDWGSLRRQVQRWQSVSSLGWSDQDINEVARHLNQHYYRFAEPTSRQAAQTPAR